MLHRSSGLSAAVRRRRKQRCWCGCTRVGVGRRPAMDTVPSFGTKAVRRTGRCQGTGALPAHTTFAVVRFTAMQLLHIAKGKKKRTKLKWAHCRSPRAAAASSLFLFQTVLCEAHFNSELNLSNSFSCTWGKRKKKQQHLLIHCCPLSGRDNLAAQQQNMTFGHLILLRTLWCKLGWRNINHLTRASRAAAAYTWKQKQCFSGSKQA